LVLEVPLVRQALAVETVLILFLAQSRLLVVVVDLCVDLPQQLVVQVVVVRVRLLQQVLQEPLDRVLPVETVRAELEAPLVVVVVLEVLEVPLQLDRVYSLA
jgi:hypothetical protein